MADKAERQSFVFSVVLHCAVFLVFCLSIVFKPTLPVFENTKKHDMISAVILGDVKTSKILPQKIKVEDAPKIEEKIIKPKPPKQKVIKKPQPIVNKDTIGLKKIDKKKEAEKKLIENFKKNNIFGKDLLADIKTQTEKQKMSQNVVETNIQKTLQNETEKTLRQQLLNEEIKIKGLAEKQSQGIVNRYQALILQAISENWLVPPQVNKKLSCELMIKLAANGNVLSVHITRSSGDVLLDSSARRAVLKASPLPVPKEPENFEAFRQFALTVKPENLL